MKLHVEIDCTFFADPGFEAAMYLTILADRIRSRSWGELAKDSGMFRGDFPTHSGDFVGSWRFGNEREGGGSC